MGAAADGVLDGQDDVWFLLRKEWGAALAGELGDFQTPPALVDRVLSFLASLGQRWTRMLEPTCGRGHFISAAARLPHPPLDIQGIEIQAHHAVAARQAAVRLGAAFAVSIRHASIFDLDVGRDLRWQRAGPLLVVGNLPWVTSAAIGAAGGTNRPPRTNPQGLRGLDAVTGAANFDIAESIWLKLIRELSGQDATLALLCKTGVARRVLHTARAQELPVQGVALHRLDAARWFGVSVDACLFTVTIARPPRYAVPVYGDLAGGQPAGVMGHVNGHLVADVDRYAGAACIEGTSPVTWRQGIKHDAAAVLELVCTGSGPQNKLGEAVDVEPVHVYPLLKGTDLFRSDAAAAGRLQRALIVTQTRLREDTQCLQSTAPRLWAYLQRHASLFARRKSAVYRGQPPFAIFGIGPYAFAPYKVAVSGFHKQPRFRVVGPAGGRPVLLDDTCYFVACPSLPRAAFLAALLNHPLTLDFLRSAAFADAKRPITKRLLQRINLQAVADAAGPASLRAAAAATLARCGGDPRTVTWPAEPADWLA